jgi:iron complex transport system substrate-binding protein
MWLADLLHPDVFNYDVRAEMKTAYKTLYNYELSDADIDGILWMAQQGDAAGYDRFKAN